MNKRCARRFDSGRTSNGMMEPLFNDEYRCLDCGYRVFDEMPEFKPMETEQKSKHAVDEKYRYRGKGSIVPCAVIGCDRTMVKGAEMCGKCLRYLKYYNNHKTHKLPPPIAKDDAGRWVKRTGRAA